MEHLKESLRKYMDEKDKEGYYFYNSEKPEDIKLINNTNNILSFEYVDNSILWTRSIYYGN